MSLSVRKSKRRAIGVSLHELLALAHVLETEAENPKNRSEEPN